jgi:hypothetical protein
MLRDVTKCQCFLALPSQLRPVDPALEQRLFVTDGSGSEATVASQSISNWQEIPKVLERNSGCKIWALCVHGW